MKAAGLVVEWSAAAAAADGVAVVAVVVGAAADECVLVVVVAAADAAAVDVAVGELAGYRRAAPAVVVVAVVDLVLAATASSDWLAATHCVRATATGPSHLLGTRLDERKMDANADVDGIATVREAAS